MVQLLLLTILQPLKEQITVCLENAMPIIRILAAGVIELQRSLITHQLEFFIDIVLKKLVTRILVLIIATIQTLIVPILIH